VQRQLHPVADRLNELDELDCRQHSAPSRTRTPALRLAIKLAADKATEADQHAIDAGNRANAAQTTAQTPTRASRASRRLGNIDQYHPINQAEIRFRRDRTF